MQNGGQFTTKKVQFAANCTAISTKTQCNLRQNAMQLASKRSAISIKMQCKMLLNARRNATKCKVKCIILHIVCWVYWSTIDNIDVVLVRKST